MNNMPDVYLKEIEWPEFGKASPLLYPLAGELRNRIENCRKLMKSKGISHLVVYGDKEHFAAECEIVLLQNEMV